MFSQLDNYFTSYFYSWPKLSPFAIDHTIIRCLPSHRRRPCCCPLPSTPPLSYCSTLRVGVYFYPRKAPLDSIPAPPNRIIVRTRQKIALIIVEAAERPPAALVSPSSLANSSCNANDIVTPYGSIADNIIANDAPPPPRRCRHRRPPA